MGHARVVRLDRRRTRPRWTTSCPPSESCRVILATTTRRDALAARRHSPPTCGSRLRIRARRGALATAARCAGAPVRVAGEWFARGPGTHPDRPCTPLYADFAQAIEEARGEFVARRIRRIEQAAERGNVDGRCVSGDHPETTLRPVPNNPRSGATGGMPAHDRGSSSCSADLPHEPTPQRASRRPTRVASGFWKHRQLTDSDPNPSVRRRVPTAHWIRSLGVGYNPLPN